MNNFFGTPEKLSQIRLWLLGLFDEMVNPATTDERRSEIVGQINDLAELTRIEMAMSTATELIPDEEQ